MDSLTLGKTYRSNVVMSRQCLKILSANSDSEGRLLGWRESFMDFCQCSDGLSGKMKQQAPTVHLRIKIDTQVNYAVLCECVPD